MPAYCLFILYSKWTDRLIGYDLDGWLIKAVFLTLSTPSRSKVPKSLTIFEKYCVLHFEKENKVPWEYFVNEKCTLFDFLRHYYQTVRIPLFMFRYVLLVKIELRIFLCINRIHNLNFDSPFRFFKHILFICFGFTIIFYSIYFRQIHEFIYFVFFWTRTNFQGGINWFLC